MIKKNLSILFFLAVSITAVGQPYPSRLGRFQVDQKKGCVPFTITLTNLLVGDCTPGKPCVMDYESNNTQQQNQFTHTYTTAGTYKLSVLYQSIGTDDITITVDPNPVPNFEIYACSGAQAAIRVIDNNYDQYVIDFNSDNVPENILPFSNNILTPSHAYVPAGSYTASVRGRRLNSADNCATKQQPFQTLAVLPTPTINTLTSVSSTSIKLDFSIAANILYRLEIAVNNSATYQLQQTLYGINTITLTGLKLDDNYYCFRLGAFDPCSSTSNYSNQICSDKFTASPQSDVNKLVWSTGATPFVANYAINIKVNNTTTNFTISNPAASTYDDTNITCKNNYCYQITTTYAGGSKSISLEKCVDSFSNKIPTAITDISSEAGTSGVDLTWLQDPKFTPVNYSVKRSWNGIPLTFYTLTTAAKLTDKDYTSDYRICYQISYTDKCGNNSPDGSTVCPLRLTGTLDKKNSITLVWGAYAGWKNGVKDYLVQKYNLTGTLIKTFTVTDTTLLDDQPDPANQYVRYQIKAVPKDVLPPASLSNVTEFIKNANLFHPTAFTPNSDNLNDGFNVTGQFISKISLKIFDRWGVLLFATDKNEPWNGHVDGKAMPPSTYVWKAEISDLAGRTFSLHGTVVLLRN